MKRKRATAVPKNKQPIPPKTQAKDAQRQTITTKIVAMFDSYASAESLDVIDYRGIERLCIDCDISPGGDIRVLILMWKCECKTYGVISRSEFCFGLEALRAFDLQTLKDKLFFIKTDFANHPEQGQFAKFFAFVFKFTNTPEEKRMDMDTVKPLMKMCLRDIYPDTAKTFLQYVMKERSLPNLHYDHWCGLLDALIETKGAMTYSEDSSWPLIID